MSDVGKAETACKYINDCPFRNLKCKKCGTPSNGCINRILLATKMAREASEDMDKLLRLVVRDLQRTCENCMFVSSCPKENFSAIKIDCEHWVWNLYHGAHKLGVEVGNGTRK